MEKVMRIVGCNNWFMAKMVHHGTIKMNVLMVIPFILYFSKSIIDNPDKKTHGAALYSVHITPFLSFSFAWRNS